MSNFWFQRMTLIDLERIEELRPEGWNSIVEPHRLYLSQPFCESWKLGSAQESLAGIGSVLVFGASAWLAQIIVRQEFRGHGLGGRIVAHLLERAKAHGCETVSLIATELGKPVYSKHGFISQCDYFMYDKASTAVERLDQTESSIQIEAAQEGDSAKICELDAEASGEDRRPMLELHMAGANVVRHGENLRGFYLPEMGEGLIIARDTAAGRALLSLKIAAGKRIVIPAPNADAASLLVAHSYVPVPRGTRMVLGKAFPWKPEAYYSRIAGNMG